MTVEELCLEIETRRTALLERERESYPRNNPVASDLSECARETALAILHWQDRPPFAAETIARFRRGKVIEDEVLRELGTLGISVRTERAPFEIIHKGRVVLRGKVDGFVQWQRRDWPLEVKSVDPNIFRRIRAVEDFQKLKWAKKWPRQLQAYLYGLDEEEGFFLLDNCMGAWRLVPVRLDYQEMDAILRRIEAAVEAVEAVRAGKAEADVLPPFHEDADVCRSCWAFGRTCFPPVDAEGLQVLDDEDLEMKLDRRGALSAAYREYLDLDEDVKAALKGKDGRVVGNWLVRGKEITRNEKERPAKTITFWQTKIESLKKGVTENGE